jgi:C_GCAxxG_C_C family probable redox protein
VLLSFADELKYSRELALKISAGFGGGMGKTQETCGAVTGAVMVLGLVNGERANNNDELLPRAYGSVKELFRQFTETFHTTRCRDLAGCDLNTPNGADRFREERIRETICADCVARAVQIVESMTG